MKSIPTSIESQARMYPSRVYTVHRTTDRIFCSCCQAVRAPGWYRHPILGLLCSGCSRAFDPAIDNTGRNIAPTCPHCEDGDCPFHD